MPIAKIQLPDGRIAKFEVPEGTTPDQVVDFANEQFSGMQDQPSQGMGRKPIAAGVLPIQQASKKFRAAKDIQSLSIPEDNSIPGAYRQQAGQEGFLSSGAISTGRGLAKIGRALGFVDPETEPEKMAFQAIKENQPLATFAGEVIGEALPFLPFGVAAGGIKSLAGRTVGTGVVGTLEGGLIQRGEGKGESKQIKGGIIGGAVAGGTELLIPFIGSIGRKIFRRVRGKAPTGALITKTGEPTQELIDVMATLDIDFDDMKEAAIDLLGAAESGTIPEQAARAARFKQAGIPATRGDITQEFTQQATEARLVQSASDKLSDPLRALRLRQSEGLTGNLKQIIEKSGVPDDIGESIRDALSGRKATLRSKKNALYKSAAKAADDVGFLPFPTTEIANALPDERTISRLNRIKGNQVEPIMDLLAEFGIDTSEKALKNLENKGINLDQLSISNFDEFRMALNQIERADQTGTSAVIIGPIREALDNEAANLANIFEKSGITDKNILDPLIEARKTVMQLKKEFSPDAITGKLINTKRDGVTPVIEASQVYKNIVGTNKPIEYLERTILSLTKSGPDGIKAIGDLQAATVMDLIESGFKAETRKIQGSKTFGTVPFLKRLNDIGEDRLNLIFSTNPGLLKDIRQVAKVASDLTPPSDAVPKGSAPVILDVLNKLGIMTILGKTPGGGLFAEQITKLSEGAATRKEVIRAMNASPQVEKSINALNRMIPSFFIALGLSFGREQTENKRK